MAGGDDEMNDALRSERMALFDMVGLTGLDEEDRRRIDEAIDGADQSFGFRLATSFVDDDVIITGEPRSLAGARAPFCPYTCLSYRNPEWLTWFDRDRWAEKLGAAVNLVAESHSMPRDLDVIWHGAWVVAVSGDALDAIASIVDAIASRLQAPTRRSEVGRVAASGPFSETYRLIDPAQQVPTTLIGVESVEVELTSLRFWSLQRFQSVVTVRDSPAFEWLEDFGVPASPATRGLRGDDAVVANRLAATIPPGAVLERIVRSSRDGPTVVRFEGPSREPEEWFDDRSALLAAADGVAQHLPAMATSDGLAYARSRLILTATTEAGGTDDSSLKHRRCPTGPWTWSVGAHSMSRFDRPDGPPGRSMLLAWATVPGVVGHTVIEATSSGVTITEGGSASLTVPLAEQLARLDHGSLGTRWFLDGEILLGQVWWEVDSVGDRLSGPSTQDVSSVFNELDRLIFRT